MGYSKHLMTGPKGNSEFCFPETLNIGVEGKLNSLFPSDQSLNALIYLLAQKYWKKNCSQIYRGFKEHVSVFIWRNHIPKLNITFPSVVLVLSDERPCRNLTFHNVLARQSSSYCNRARLNFQAFALRDMKIATREGCRVGQKMSFRFSFC